jgi:hypothetical protein
MQPNPRVLPACPKTVNLDEFGPESITDKMVNLNSRLALREILDAPRELRRAARNVLAAPGRLPPANLCRAKAAKGAKKTPPFRLR